MMNSRATGFSTKKLYFFQPNSEKGNETFLSKVIPLTPQFYNRQGFPVKTEYVYGTIYSELGMSIHYDPEQGLLFFGAPGTWNWTGTAVV